MKSKKRNLSSIYLLLFPFALLQGCKVGSCEDGTLEGTISGTRAGHRVGTLEFVKEHILTSTISSIAAFLVLICLLFIIIRLSYTLKNSISKYRESRMQKDLVGNAETLPLNEVDDQLSDSSCFSNLISLHKKIDLKCVALTKEIPGSKARNSSINQNEEYYKKLKDHLKKMEKLKALVASEILRLKGEYFKDLIGKVSKAGLKPETRISIFKKLVSNPK